MAFRSCRLSVLPGVLLPVNLRPSTTIQHVAMLTFSVTPWVKRKYSGSGILNQIGIDYSLRPRLSTRLTLGGRTFPRNPWDLGEPEFNRLYRYLCLHSHSQALHGRLPFHFVALGTLSYPATLASCSHGFGIWLKSRSFSAQFRSMGQLLRTV